jgi:hypothetical protein
MTNNQKYNTPKFSQDLYDKHDAFGKRVSKEFLTEFFGFKPIGDTTEHYASFDFAMKDGKDKFILVEAECRPNWNTYNFPYSKVNVPCRKSTSNADILVVVNGAGNSILMCDMSVVKTSPKERVDTTLSKDELFFRVPYSKMRSFWNVGFVWKETTQPKVS